MVTDTRDRLSVPGIAKLFEEMAWQHARRLGVDFTDDSPFFWVLSRIRVEISTLPVWSQHIHLETWPSGVERLFACREFRLRDHSRPNGRDLILGTSRWLVMSAEKGRPVPPGRAFDLNAIPATERVLTEEPKKLAPAGEPSPDATADASPTVVRYNDLDRNRHTNNTRYLVWMLDALGPELQEEYRIADFDVNYTAESHYGDSLWVHAPAPERRGNEAGDELEFRPHIVRRRDGATVALARFRFIPNDAGG